MKSIILWTVIFFTVISGSVNAQYDPFLKINVNLGEDINTFVNSITTFDVYASSLLGNHIVRYEWDINGDDTIDVITTESKLMYTYYSTGTYRVKVIVYDNQENSSYSCINVIVNQGSGIPTKVPSQTFQAITPALIPGDGLCKTYAILFCGSSDYWFWPQADSIYNTLRNVYQIPAEHIFLLYSNGLNPQFQNPNGIIFNKATKENLQSVLYSLSTIIDEDDKLFVWINSHGAGYGADRIQSTDFRNVLLSRAFVDNNRERYCKESDFKLRTFYQGEPFVGAYGMNQWHMSFDKENRLCRIRIVSSFSNLLLQDGTFVTDNDVFLEKQIDYKSPNGDWENIDRIEQNFNGLTGGNAPGLNQNNYVLFDKDFDNKLDIDFDQSYSYILQGHINELTADATDTDNDGIIVGVDVNNNGTKEDWITVENWFTTYNNKITDIEFANMLSILPTNNINIVMNSCYCGGFVYELSKKGRIVISATEKDMLAIAINGFAENFNSSISNSTLSDINSDSKVNIIEAYNYSMQQMISQQSPLYDDNGDGIGHTDLNQDDTEGCWGSINTIVENLLENIILSNQTISSNCAVKGKSISATNVLIENNSNIQFNTSGEILLNNGFEIKQGSSFESNNSICP